MTQNQACCHHSSNPSVNSSKNIYKQFLVKAIISMAAGIIYWFIADFKFAPSLTTSNGRIAYSFLAVIALGILLYCGGYIYRSGWESLKHHRANMNTLIAIGTGIAWLFSIWIIIAAPSLPQNTLHVYFETALLIVGFINLGTALEIRARSKTSQAIEKLVQLQAKIAHVIRNNEEFEVAIDDLQTNDLIRVYPGEKIPADGVITKGETYIDESMLTGEPAPAHKKKADQIFAGTINKTGNFVFKATRVGAQTTLFQIIKWVKAAQNTKPQIARLADQVSSWFVPIVLITAVLTALIWFNWGPEPKLHFMLLTSMAVLVIACPCALGLAAPISVIAGMGKAAENGLLVRHGDALQQMRQLDTLVFDKTGTLTQGHPVLVKIIALPESNENEILQLAASLEQFSEHPYAEAIIKYAKHKQLALLSVESFEAHSGLGIRGEIASHIIYIGNSAWLKKNKIAIPSLETQKQDIKTQTCLYIANEQKILGLLQVSDPIKPEAPETIQHLQKMGLEIILLTGDRHNTAKAIAQQLNIHKVLAEVLPTEKAAQIKQLQDGGRKVGMVGDGINDAPALIQADVGFALSQGTDIAIESADVVVVRASLTAIPQALIIGKATLQNIKQNLWGAFIFNLLAIPIAAGVLYPWLNILLNPAIAGAAMALSSVTVVMNANRLRYLKLNKNKYGKRNT